MTWGILAGKRRSLR